MARGIILAYRIGRMDEMISALRSIDQVRFDILRSDLGLQTKRRLLYIFKFAPSLRRDLLRNASPYPVIILHLFKTLRLLKNAKRVKEIQLSQYDSHHLIAITDEREHYRFLVNLFPLPEFPTVHDLYPFVDIFAMGVYDYYPIAGKVVDVGGYIGDTAAYFCKKGATQVEVYEPNPHNYQFLQTNLELNSVAERVKPFLAAITRSDGTSTLSVPRFLGGAGSLYDRSAESSQIEVNTVHCRKVLSGRIDLLKLDCKGCEVDIVSECGEELRSNVAHIIGQALDSMCLEKFVNRLRELEFVIDKIDMLYNMVYARNPNS